MSKSVKYDFYRVECPEGDSFREILQRVSQKPDDESRTHEFSDKHVRLQEIEEKRTRFEGEVLRIRMNDVPVKATLAGDLEDLELDDDEGIGEETAFVYDWRLNVLVLQRNRMGVSAPAFCRYFERAGNLDGIIDLDPILERNAYDRMTQMQHISKFEIAIAGVDNFNKNQFQNESVSNLIDICNSLDAPSVQLTVSVGRQRSISLSLGGIKELGRRLQRWYQNNHEQGVSKLRVSGSARDTDPMEVVDLIKDRMCVEAELEMDAHRRLSFADRLAAAVEALRTKRATLVEMYDPGE